MAEREVKLLLDPGTKLPRPEQLFDGLGDWTRERVEQHAVYHDTADLALARAGASLRYRSDDGWTVKIPQPRDGVALVRAEHGFAGGPGAPPPAAADLVRAWTRARPLVEVARVHTDRGRWRVVDRRGEPLVEVDDDRVTTEAADRGTSEFRELEIEVLGGAGGRTLDELVRRLRASGAEPTGGMPKVVRALGPRAQAPPDLDVPAPPARSATLAELVRFTIASGVQRLLDHDPVVRASDDPEGVHQARVATRRLRSDLRTFRRVIDESWSEPLRDELRWIGALLGGVRDADVLGARLDELRADLPPDDRLVAGELLERLRAHRARDRDELLDAMRSARYIALLDALVDAAASPRLRAERADDPARDTLAVLLHRPWKRLRRRVERLPADPSDPDLHDVRKAAKQARYAFEAIAPIAGGRATRAAKRLAAVQTRLGDHQDAVVAIDWLRAAAADTDRPPLAFAAGRLTCAFAAEHRARRAEWLGEWKRARRAVRKAQARTGA